MFALYLCINILIGLFLALVWTELVVLNVRIRTVNCWKRIVKLFVEGMAVAANSMNYLYQYFIAHHK